MTDDRTAHAADGELQPRLDGLPLPIDLAPEARSTWRLFVVRVLVLLTIISGSIYISWRWFFSLNFDAWWIAIPLVLAETYALIDVFFFGFTLWRARTRAAPPPAPPGLTVDVFITT